jgi:hypothetical protein
MVMRKHQRYFPVEAAGGGRAWHNLRATSSKHFEPSFLE